MRRDYYAAADRSLPGLCHLPEDRSLLPVLRDDHPHPHGSGERHPQPDLPEDQQPLAGLLQRRAKGGHHRPHERRRARDREQHHVFPGHAVQESHPHHFLFRHADIHLLAAHALHAPLRAPLRLVHGLCGQETESPQHRGATTLERHHEPSGRDAGRTAHHQGFLRGGEDEPALCPGE